MNQFLRNRIIQPDLFLEISMNYTKISLTVFNSPLSRIRNHGGDKMGVEMFPNISEAFQEKYFTLSSSQKRV